MDVEKQRLIISIIAGNRDLMALCSGIIKPSYFDPSLKKAVKFIRDYFNTYKDVPKIQTIRAETGLILEDAGRIDRADIAYVSKEIEEFCQERAVTEAVIESSGLIGKRDFGKIIELLKGAVSVGLNKDAGINYFLNPEERLNRTLVNEARISTGWSDLDVLLGGGISRQELITFCANSGIGKSMTMLNLSRNLLSQGLNGVYISLEMAEGIVSKRLDSMISKIGQTNLLSQISKVALSIEKAATTMGTFYIKRMPENRTNINHVKSYLQQLEQSNAFRPDFIVIDYIDIMGSTQSVSYDNVFQKDKLVSEEIRGLGFDYDATIISASQLNRNSIDAEKISQAHIAGGISKINTTDYMIGIKQDDLMKAKGEISFDILKSRNSGGVGHKVILKWDPISLLITSFHRNAPLELKKKPSIPLETRGTIFENPKKEDGILNLMNT